MQHGAVVVDNPVRCRRPYFAVADVAAHSGRAGPERQRLGLRCILPTVLQHGVNFEPRSDRAETARQATAGLNGER